MSEILPRAATFSKGIEFWSGDPIWQPATLIGGLGGGVQGTDDRLYLDWVSALGSNLLGYGQSGFSGAVANQVWRGTGFSLPHYLEQQTAEKLVSVLAAHVPGWQAGNLSVRWGLSGSDACSMAVRLARAVTGRERIISCGYHGWHSEFIGLGRACSAGDSRAIWRRGRAGASIGG
jgi:glutamate-1-semialdehyde aminotransferase